MTTARWEGSAPSACTESPTAGPDGSAPVTVTPLPTGTIGPHRVVPSAPKVPKRTDVPGVAACASTRVAVRGWRDSPKYHEAVWPERSEGRGSG